MTPQRTTPAPSFLRTLRDLNTDDLLKAAGLTGAARVWPALRRLSDGPSLVLARRLEAFDQAAGLGLQAEAARDLLAQWGTRVVSTGAGLADSGPRLFVANHPGLGDVLALLSVLNLPDLKIVARDRPFLRAMPRFASHLFLVPEAGAWSVLRRVADHLAGGGAVLTFPAGRIEADPAWSDPSATWPAWSGSTALWSRMVPGLAVQPLMVAGVRARGFVDPWAARWRRNPEDRDWTAAVLQLVCQVLWSRPRAMKIEVAAGPILEGRILAGPGGKAVLDSGLAGLARRVSRR